jgi:hypothetical protein
MGIPSFAKNTETMPEECAGALSYRKLPEPSFLKLRPNMMNASAQSLNHLSIKFTIYNVLSSTNS